MTATKPDDYASLPARLRDHFTAWADALYQDGESDAAALTLAFGDESAAAIESLQAKLQAAERDAARYRWLRGPTNSNERDAAWQAGWRVITLRTRVAVVHEGEHMPYGRRTVQIELTAEQEAAISPRKLGTWSGEDVLEEIGACWLESNHAG